jgi:quinol monooxygenase YgiN
MILLIMTVNAKPDKARELEQTLVLLAQRARQEPGCLGRHVYRDAEQADGLCLIEVWATQMDVDAYRQTVDWLVMKGATELLGVTGQVQFCTVTETELIDVPSEKVSRQ